MSLSRIIKQVIVLPHKFCSKFVSHSFFLQPVFFKTYSKDWIKLELFSQIDRNLLKLALIKEKRWIFPTSIFPTKSSIWMKTNEENGQQELHIAVCWKSVHWRIWNSSGLWFQYTISVNIFISKNLQRVWNT